MENRSGEMGCRSSTRHPFGGGGCAAHVPPRCKVGKKSPSECQDGFRAAIHAVCRRKHRALQNQPRELRNRVLRGPKSSPEGSQIEPGGVHERQDAPKRRSRAPKRRPRAPKTRPRSAQEVPNRRPGDPQRRPRASQTRPKWTPGRPQTEDLDIFWRPCKRPAFIKALASVFACFVMIFAPSTS